MEEKALKPVRRWLWKAILELLIVWLLAAAFIVFMAIVIANDSAGSVSQAILIGVGAWTPFLLLGLILMPAYFNRLHYVIHPDEVVVEVGIVTQSVKHVPYRTVTNIQVARGPFDRLFGIGTLKIQTAGMSGQSGAEESLVGLADVTSVYQQVAATLRSFRQAMPPTGVGEEQVEGMSDAGALYQEVRSIRHLLEQRI